ncbi:hypothetical protein EYV94_14835 [Puteibacter caeruleilacunae]|nr:hypothetical protein EYV94_14835 [Puteibacter caeruleilacunae]
MTTKPFNFRRFLRIIHRDFGYFIAALTIVYSISGIALNHNDTWNPDYIIRSESVELQLPDADKFSKEELKQALEKEHLKYRKHYTTKDQTIKVFVPGGTVELNPSTKRAWIETVSKRPFFFQINKLHYGKQIAWKWFSDIFAVLLIIVSLSGIFILKGKHGITRRGLIYTLAGLIIPILFLVFVM